jgi:DNA-binding MarR family transcriptional regulator
VIVVFKCEPISSIFAGLRQGLTIYCAAMPSRRAAPLRLIPHLHRATHQVGLHIAGLRDLGVTQAEAHILDHLASHGDSTVGQLHQAFAHRRSTLTSVLDRLADRGLILREVSDVDRRTFLVRPTAAGRSLAARVHDALARVEARALAQAAPRDRDGFLTVLAALGRSLKAEK